MHAHAHTRLHFNLTVLHTHTNVCPLSLALSLSLSLSLTVTVNHTRSILCPYIHSVTSRVEAKLEHWYVTGLEQHGAVPSLIASVGDATSSLLSILFELNPEGSSADQLIRVQSQPVEIIYDAVSSEPFLTVVLFANMYLRKIGPRPFLAQLYIFLVFYFICKKRVEVPALILGERIKHVRIGMCTE